jgi:AbrB family looped-hinge helix DNA binding protein
MGELLMDNKNFKREKIEGKFIGSVKVGPKGQIVIPKEARDLFNIKAGDTLILLADVERGIAIQGYELFQKFADQAFDKEKE